MTAAVVPGPGREPERGPDQGPLDAVFVLPADATLEPVVDLPPRVRAALGPGTGPGDLPDSRVAVSRPRYRVPTRLVSAELASLLTEFREPSRIVDAVLRFSRAGGRDPFRTLEDSFDALTSFVGSRVLVPADSADARSPLASLWPGDTVGEFEVTRMVAVLADTEVHAGTGAAGEPVAIKIARPDASALVDLALDREATILAHLDGRAGPRLLDRGTHDGRPYLVQQWRAGTPLSVAARRVGAGADGRARLHQLGVALLSAYADLHACGVLHGDVHPGNVVVGEDLSVTLLDFGRSAITARRSAGSTGRDPLRAGIAYFYEPEMAAALLTDQVPPAVTAAGEQYSVAALLYLVLTGEHRLDFSLDSTILLHQVLDLPPRAFVTLGLPPWPGVEDLLARALDRDPARRFAGMTELRDAFAAARPAAAQGFSVPPGGMGGRRLIRAALGRVLTDPRGAQSMAGADDLAWFALRAAQVREDPDLLAAADGWAGAAGRRAAGDASLAPVVAGIDRARGARRSTAAAPAGWAGMGAADTWSGGAGPAAGPGMDLLGGSCGLLLAAVRVLEREDDPRAHPLSGIVSDALAGLFARMAAQPPIGEPGALPHLGLAHGWAGLLYTALRAASIVGAAVPADVLDRLDQLAAIGRGGRNGLRWPGTILHPGVAATTPNDAPGWCSGSAGHVLLWTEASRVLDDRALLDRAAQAARYALEHPARNPDFCCGTTGRAAALLRLYQATGEPRWLTGARRLCAAAAAAWRPSSADPTLRRGPLGTALLVLELEQPEAAELPPFS